MLSNSILWSRYREKRILVVEHKESHVLTSTSPSGSVPRWPTSSYTSQMPKSLSTRAAFPGHGVAPMEGSVVLLNRFFFYLWSELKYLKLIVV